MSNQHDSHCLMTFNGINWRITSIDPAASVMYMRSIDHARVHCAVDYRGIDWQGYCFASVQMLYQNTPQPKRTRQ